MCGIVAIFAYSAAAGPVDGRELDRIRDAMAPRGPDAFGSWRSDDGRVGMGHRRLAIIDVGASGNQPMAIAATGTRITFNGEIYNYRALRRELEQQGRAFRTGSDTEVLLHAYEVWGESMVERLRGMFAFALWDERRHGLLLARDPLGIKPLYYTNDGRRLIVASQVKALLAADGVGSDLSAAGQMSFLLWGFIIEPRTLYRDIVSLPAGSTMWIDAHGARSPWKYWEVNSALQAGELQRATMSESALIPTVQLATLRDALLDSIRHHMVSDVPVGLFLSGGLDSATLVSLATERSLGDLRTLTLGIEEFRGTAEDETAPAEEIARMHHTRHQTRWIGVDQFGRERSHLLAAMDQPTVDGANVYFVAQAAAAAGLKVAMSGLGADELFGGYPSYRQVPRLARLLRSFGGPRAIGRGLRVVSAPMLKRFTSPKYASLFEYGTTIEDAYLLRRGLFLPWEIADILGPEVARDAWQELDLHARLRRYTSGVESPHAKVAALEMSVYMRNQLLRDSDWAGMAHSLEIRVPFVDATLLDQLAPYVAGPVPLGKIAMTQTTRLPLPQSILARPKTGFSLPIRNWLMQGAVGATPTERGLRAWARYILGEQVAYRVPVTA